MAKKKRKGQQFPRSKDKVITYNKYKPNRQARRLGIKAEEPPKEEVREERPKTLGAKLSESVQRVKEIQRKVTPPGMTYGEYMGYLKEKGEELKAKKR